MEKQHKAAKSQKESKEASYVNRSLNIHVWSGISIFVANLFD
jgi:hypothetical protein